MGDSMDAKEMLDFLSHYKRIFLYGAGKWGRNIAIYLDTMGINVDAFVVSKYEKRKSQYLQKEILEFEGLEIEKDDIYLVCIADSEEIIEKLERVKDCQFYVITSDIYDAVINTMKSGDEFARNRFLNGKALFLYYD